MLQWIINIPGVRLQFFRLKVYFEKFKYLRITFAPTTYFVEAYDGPDTLSPRLQSKYLNTELHEILTSKFQCILNVWMGCTNPFSYQNTFVFSLLDKTPFNNVILNPKNISSFTYHYSGQKINIDITKIVVPDNLKVNISIQNMSHNYNMDLLCSNGGFVVYDVNEMKHEINLSSKCSPHRYLQKPKHLFQ